MKYLKMRNVHKYHNLLLILCVTIPYLFAFFALENRQVPVHIIQCDLDKLIPFCEYFIVPYLFWFVYVAMTVAYFAFFNEDKDNREFKALLCSLVVGLVVFLLISYFYPNGQLLRPFIEGDTIFKQLVLNLYQTDTSTNILPSLHVYHSVACVIAFEKHDKMKNVPLLLNAIRILTVSIVLATMFLKQHSVIDVFLAITMNGICYHLFYVGAYVKEWGTAKSSYKRRKKKLEGF